MVYCDYYYIYNFSTYDSETDVIDNVTDSMSKMDVWDLDTLTCTSSNANIEMVHAVYNYIEEEYADATFSVEYYVNVSDIIRDEKHRLCKRDYWGKRWTAKLMRKVKQVSGMEKRLLLFLLMIMIRYTLMIIC